MVGEAEVVVGAEVEHLVAALDADVRACGVAITRSLLYRPASRISARASATRSFCIVPYTSPPQVVVRPVEHDLAGLPGARDGERLLEVAVARSGA